MSADERILHSLESGWLFWCPGCKCAHLLDQRWTKSGTDEAPTFAPSLLHIGPKGGDGANLPVRCHLFVRNGQLQFLGDCGHSLAGKTVPMEPF